MPRHKIGIKQEHFDFAITPKNDKDKLIVQTLRTMQQSGEFSAWIRTLVYNAVQNETAVKSADNDKA